MPGGDRTGPMGMGPMTGRGAGFCAGAGVPGFISRMGGAFLGRGRGGGVAAVDGETCSTPRACPAGCEAARAASRPQPQSHRRRRSSSSKIRSSCFSRNLKR